MPDVATKPAPTLNRPLYRVRLLAGHHFDVDENGGQVMYKVGDVFMCRKPYYRKWPEKFARVEDYVPLTTELMRIVPDGEQADSDEEMDPISGATPQPTAVVGATPPQKPVPLVDDATLNTMTINELKSYAEDEEIDLRNTKSKEDILRVIRGNRAP